jgi:Crp-like helix-turn-helix domain
MRVIDIRTLLRIELLTRWFTHYSS